MAKSEEASPTGACPVCDAELSRFDVLIEYERSDGEPAAYAECPDCQCVVHPT